MSTKLIVALDFDVLSDAIHLVSLLDNSQCALKVGSEMFTRFGPDWVRFLISKQFKVFLDLKFHDIPTTVARACKASADLGVWMLNVHASGGIAMMEQAREAILSYGNERPLLIAVTVLTSDTDKQSEQRTLDLATFARDASLDGVVSSVQFVSSIKSAFGMDFLTVTPGIRRESDLRDDQHLIATPREARQAGSDYIVVGRPITQAKEPALVVQEILKMME